jgi:ribosome maturation factor RimP
MSRNPLQQRLISIVEPVLVSAGYELVDLRFLLEQSGWVLRVQVDHLPERHMTSRVGVADCEKLSRELSAVLDVEDPIPQAYNLEVSTPGIERPLRTARHFEQFVGHEARIQLAVPLHVETGERGQETRRNFRGTLRGVANDRVVIDCDGHRFELPLADIDHARLVPDWDAVMQKRQQN